MKKQCFVNPHVKHTRRGIKDFLLWKIGYYDDEEKGQKTLSSFFWPAVLPPLQQDNPWAMWINHSTFLISVGGINILTDPIWSNRCSPCPFLGPKRRHPPGIALSQLPEIDLVLLSHDHYDHLDKKTVLALSRMFPHISWFVPKEVKKWFDRHKISSVYEFGWWEERELCLPAKKEVKGKITAVPAQHFSGRGGFDVNSTLWLGWVLDVSCGQSGGKRCYFVGDTGYNAFDFKRIKDQFSPIDLSLIPIGSYLPRAFMKTVHVSPTEAVRIHQEVGSKFSVGMHWKTFALSDEPMNLPPYDLYQTLLQEKIDPKEFIIAEPGHAFNW
jgi:N-acyl-phosphatidylethanolamine-hydrolysing phospholipase D